MNPSHFPKTYQTIPKGWKQCLKFSFPEKQEDSKPKPIKRSPIKPIGERTKRRLKEHGSETEMFREIIRERGTLYCEECGMELPNPKPHNFDHVKGKGMNSELRMDKTNIRVLCFVHHFEKTTGLKYKGINLD